MKHSLRTGLLALGLSLTTAGCSTWHRLTLGGSLHSDYYAAPNDAWSVHMPSDRQFATESGRDGVDDNGGRFFEWSDPWERKASVRVTPTESIAALGGIEKLADDGISELEGERKAAGETFRVLSRSMIEVHGRRGVRHVVEFVVPSKRLPLLGEHTNQVTSIAIEDLVDWDDVALVRFRGMLTSSAEVPITPDTETEEAKAALMSLEDTFRMPAERAR